MLDFGARRVLDMTCGCLFLSGGRKSADEVGGRRRRRRRKVR
jgi:hypothetical protein